MTFAMKMINVNGFAPSIAGTMKPVLEDLREGRLHSVQRTSRGYLIYLFGKEPDDLKG